jgi:iron complex outermembrane receptor protein
LPRIRPLHRALILAFAAPAMSAFAADPAPADAPQEPTQLAQVQAQVQAAAPTAGAGEKIEISAQREHYRGDVAVEDLPQAVQVITGELMKQVGAVKLNDALDLAAGVARQNTFGGVWDSFAIRGFVGDPNVPSGYLVNGFNGGRGFGGLRDTSSVEKMEILKGPGSALFGRSEPGGTVSITTKKPQFTPEGSLSFALGSFDFYRLEGDYTTPLGDSTAVRINGAFEDADSFRDTVHSKRQFASPSIIQKIGNDTQIWYELEWSDQKIPFDRGVVARNGELGIIPNSRYLGEPGDGPTEAKVLGHQAELQHIFWKSWVLLIGGAVRNTKLNGIGENPEFAAARQPFFTDGQTLSRQRRFTNYESDDSVARAEVSGNLMTGAVGHHILFGADWEDFQLDRLQTRYRPPAFNASSTLATLNAINIFNPAYGAYPLPAANQNVFNDTEKDKSYGVYFTDQMDITKELKLRLGVRYDSFKQTIENRLAVLQPPKQDVTATSPSVGITYKISETYNVYTAFAKGFRPQTGFDVNRQPFEPEETKSGEVGLKYQFFEGDVSGNVAIFKMKKTNVLTADPVNAGQSIAIGGAESKGVEWDLTGRLPYQTTVLLAYAYTDAISTASVLDPDFGRIVKPGDPLINIPKHNANLIVLKDIDMSGHKLTVGGGVKYVGKRLGETGTQFFLPAYTLLRAQATYEVTPKFALTAEVTNLTDKVYYPASYAAIWVTPGEPRQYQLRGTYRF